MMRLYTQGTHGNSHSNNPSAFNRGVRSGNDLEVIKASIDAAKNRNVQIDYKDGIVHIEIAGEITHSASVSPTAGDSFSPAKLTEEAKKAYLEAENKVNKVFDKIKDCEGLSVKKLETSWKSGLLLGGIGGTIMVSALTLKLMLESIKKDDPETYEKLKNYQWPVLLAADIYGLLFFKKAYEAWHRPFLKEIKGNYDIYKHLAENGLVIPELITMLKQCKALITETKEEGKRFSPEVYELLKEKATWADRFLTFLVEPITQSLESKRLNLKSNNYALVNLTKEESINKLNIKNLLPVEAKKELPWHEQLIQLFEFPIDWTVGLLTGEKLATLQEVHALYNQAWQQKLLTGKSSGRADKYLSQVNAEIEERATSDYSRDFIPSAKQVEAVRTGNFSTQLLARPSNGQVLTAQRNDASSSVSPLDDPAKGSGSEFCQGLNILDSLGRGIQALLFPK